VFQLQSATLGLGDNVQFLKGRSDIPRFLLGADLLIHPAYNENTGTVLLEALVAGLPVLVSVCGYAHYIAEADSGLVLDEPFEQEQLNAVPATHARRRARAAWSRNGLAFAETADLYSMPQHADVILAEHRMKLILAEPFKSLWAGRDPFAEVEALQGEVYRELEGRRTLRTEVDGDGFSSRSTVASAGARSSRTCSPPSCRCSAPARNGGHPAPAGGRRADHDRRGLRRAGSNPADQHSFIVTEELAPTVSLEDFSIDWVKQPPEPAQARADRRSGEA
jgi:hypothetical protein